MKMNEYLSQVTDQIRCQKVHKAVRAELKAHLEDQAEAYESEGMSADEAMEKAVLENGGSGGRQVFHLIGSTDLIWSGAHSS